MEFINNDLSTYSFYLITPIMECLKYRHSIIVRAGGGSYSVYAVPDRKVPGSIPPEGYR